MKAEQPRDTTGSHYGLRSSYTERALLKTFKQAWPSLVTGPPLSFDGRDAPRWYHLSTGTLRRTYSRPTCLQASNTSRVPLNDQVTVSNSAPAPRLLCSYGQNKESLEGASPLQQRHVPRWLSVALEALRPGSSRPQQRERQRYFGSEQHSTSYGVSLQPWPRAEMQRSCDGLTLPSGHSVPFRQ
jgi:hypothetical protein